VGNQRLTQPRDHLSTPSHHGGFLGEEHGYAGEPEAFAVKLREVL